LKTFWKYIVDFHKENYHKPILLLTISFVGILLFVNDYFRLRTSFFQSYTNSIAGFLIFLTINSLIYFSILVPLLKLRGKGYTALKNYDFQLKISIFLVLLSFSMMLKTPTIWFAEVGTKEYMFLDKLLFFLQRFVLFIIPLLVLYFLKNNNTDSLYGLQFKNSNVKTYVLVLLCLIPFIYLAAQQPDFQRTYPKCKYWLFSQSYGMESWQIVSVFEFCYALELFMVELIFRGLLVVGLVQSLGKNAILPMAAVYCLFHYGKPPVEAISSFFGGYFLGIFAYYSRSIVGGVVVHVGIAMSMDLAAMMGR